MSARSFRTDAITVRRAVSWVVGYSRNMKDVGGKPCQLPDRPEARDRAFQPAPRLVSVAAKLIAVSHRVWDSSLCSTVVARAG